MKKNHQLPSLKLDDELYQLIKKSIECFNNSSSGIEIKLPQFRRWALKHFSEKVLAEGIELSIKPKPL